jgi:hypothetical protein
MKKQFPVPPQSAEAVDGSARPSFSPGVSPMIATFRTAVRRGVAAGKQAAIPSHEPISVVESISRRDKSDLDSRNLTQLGTGSLLGWLETSYESFIGEGPLVPKGDRGDARDQP